MAPHSENLRGALLMMGAMAGFVFNDGFMRVVLEDIPLVQAVFLRGIALCVLLMIWAMARGQLRYRASRADRFRIGWRGFAELIGTFGFLTSLTLMPFANISAVMQFLPLSVALSAAMFLGEPMGWRRLLAIIVGFFGVMLIVRPGVGGFDISAAFALMTVLAITLREIVTRRLSPEVPSILVALITALVVTLSCGVLSVFVEWSAVSVLHLAFLALSAGVLMFGYVCSVAAMRVGDIAFVAPFRYTALVWAILIGALVFDEIPDALALLGAAIVVGTGIYNFYRERRISRRAATGL